MNHYLRQFRSLMRKSAPPRVPRETGPHRSMETKVAGAFYKLDQSVRAGLAEGIDLAWRREPENSMDPNAVALLLRDREEKPIGYVPARVAARLAPYLDRGCPLEVTVTGVPLGPGDSTVTIRLDLTVEAAQEHAGECAQAERGRPPPC